MKRHATLALACILTLSLTACGGKKTAKESVRTTKVTETTRSGAGAKEQMKAEFRITPFQAMDKKNYDVKAVSYEDVNEDQEYLQLSLQNKSEDKSYVFMFLGLEGDDIVLTTSGINETVEPGQEKQINLILRKSSTYSLKSFGDLTFRFTTRDSNAQNQKGETDAFHIYPYGENKGVSCVFASNDSYKPLGDSEILEAGMTECKQDQFDNENMFFRLRDKTNKRPSTNSKKGSVNGQTRSATQYSEARPEQSLFGVLTYQDLMMPKAEIKELQFSLRAQDVDNLAGEPLLNKTYTVTP